MFPKKGNRGYIKGKKTKLMLIALLLVGVIIALVLIGIYITGDTGNIFSIMAVLTALPLANVITVYIAMFKFHAPPIEEYEKVFAAAGEDIFSTELIITGTNLKTIYIPYALVGKDMVLLYSPAKDIKPEKYEEYISGMLAANGVQMKVKVFCDFAPFIKRLRNMEHTTRAEADEKRLQAEAVIKSLSM